jgi:cell wall-associated NlpC family hydrolase
MMKILLFMAVSTMTCLLALVLTVPFLMPSHTGTDLEPTGVPCIPADTATRPTDVAGYGPAQLHNAGLIIAATRKLHLPNRAAVIGVATAMTESALVNVDHGDAYGPDSRGVFQQRSGWGPVSVRMNPEAAATLFFKAMLRDVPSWQSLPLTQVAATVQRNRYPNAYATHEHDADLVVEAIDYTTCATSPPAATAVWAALVQLGKPYIWGAAGPDAFDCSGLTRWAWAKAGIQIPRTSSGQYADAGPRVPRGRLQPGDLLFFSKNGTPSGIHHVGMYVGSGQMIDAPRAGEDIRILNDVFTDPYYSQQYIGATRPGTSSHAWTTTHR